MRDLSEKTFSPLSLDKANRSSLREIESSLAIGWTSLLVQTLEHSGHFEEYSTAPTPDFTLVLVVRGITAIESYFRGGWNKTIVQPGDGAMTASGRTNRQRLYSPDSGAVQTVHIYIPEYYFAAAADEYHRAGTSSHLEQPDSLGFTDPIVAQMGVALMGAVKSGAPNLYAESAAQFLATHLLSKTSRWRSPISATRNLGAFTDPRLKRVLEFIRQHYTENLTLDQLASEAAISRFHFIALFKQAVGLTPHQYLVKLRLELAAELIKKPNLSIQSVAASCGFLTPSHFSKTFQKYFGQTASEYRRRLSGSI